MTMDLYSPAFMPVAVILAIASAHFPFVPDIFFVPSPVMLTLSFMTASVIQLYDLRWSVAMKCCCFY
jgi:hypothetical protein